MWQLLGGNEINVLILMVLWFTGQFHIFYLISDPSSPNKILLEIPEYKPVNFLLIKKKKERSKNFSFFY